MFVMETRPAGRSCTLGTWWIVAGLQAANDRRWCTVTWTGTAVPAEPIS